MTDPKQPRDPNDPNPFPPEPIIPASVELPEEKPEEILSEDA